MWADCEFVQGCRLRTVIPSPFESCQVNRFVIAWKLKSKNWYSLSKEINKESLLGREDKLQFKWKTLRTQDISPPKDNLPNWNKIRNLKARTTSKIKKNIFLYVMFIKPVNPKGNQPWILVGRTNAEPEEPILWSLDSKNPLIGKDWGQEEKGVTEDEMVGWCHRLNGHEFK